MSTANAGAWSAPQQLDAEASLKELVAFVTGDQEAFLEASTNPDGEWMDDDDRREYERVEAMIARARVALGQAVINGEAA